MSSGETLSRILGATPGRIPDREFLKVSPDEVPEEFKKEFLKDSSKWNPGKKYEDLPVGVFGNTTGIPVKFL